MHSHRSSSPGKYLKAGRSANWLLIVMTLLLMAPSRNALGQTASGTLRGQVTDPSGAVIPGATVTATASTGQTKTAQSDGQGGYEFNGLAPGKYTVSAVARGFAVSEPQDVEVGAGPAARLNIQLQILVEQEKVTVEEQGTTVEVNPASNASVLVIQGKDLEALSDDPDELQSELEALAGPGAGPNGGQIYIDGFTGGQLPPKSSIREIRINQNPFSAEYDKLGYGRIEIFTKPGTGQLHGQLFADGNDASFNTLNPFVTEVPGYHSELFNGSVSGPINKKISFFFNLERRDISDNAIVNAIVLDPNFNQVQLAQAIPTSRRRTNFGPRFDFQLSPSNTLTVRYQYTENNENNDGIGQFSLASQAYNVHDTEQTLQISDTQILSANVINETRFQYIRDNNTLASQFPGLPTVTVLGAFTGGSGPNGTGGGNQLGTILDKENHYELQNYTSIVHGNHFVRLGGRLRVTTDSNNSNSNFNGVFTFPSIATYAMCVATPPCTGVNQRPSQFAKTTGPTLAQVTLVDAGLYAEDTWKLRPNMTLTYGLRFETQNQIHDRGDFAPRLSFSWGLGKGKAPKTVLRGAFGIFYDRFAYNLALLTERFNPSGLGQSQVLVTNPDFYPNIPSPLPAPSPTYYQIAPNLRAPYTMQTGASVERQLSKKATVAITYLNSRGEHQFFLNNINAPAAPGTPNTYQYNSEGIFRQNQLITNFRVNAGAKLSLFGFYTLNYAHSDLGSGLPTTATGVAGFTSGTSLSNPMFISDQSDPMADYGRASFDVHHRAVLGGTIGLPKAFRLNPFMLITSGQPYNVTLGQDLNGDSIFNDRPSFVSPGCTSVKMTPLGNFCTVPPAGATIVPINYGAGPTLFTLNLRLSKTFGFGREQGGPSGTGGGPGGGGGGPGGPGGGLGGRGLSGGGGAGGGPFGLGAATNRRYNLTFSVAARNLLNRVNLAAPVGNLDSPLFAQSNALAGGPFSSGSANRRIDFQVLFSF